MSKAKRKGLAVLLGAALSLIFAALLCLSFPMAEVHAATTYGVSSEKDLVYRMAYAKEGDTIQLNASLRMDLTDADFVRETFGPKAEPNKDVYLDATTELPAHSQTLDLNGHTLTIITGYTRCFSLTGDVTLTITDSSEDGTGAIVGYSNGSLFYSETQASSLVLQDVAVKFTEYTEGGASITPTGAVIDTVGNVTLNNVTYTPAEGDPALIEDNAGAQVSYVADTAEELAAAVADSSYSTVMLGADITQNITVEADRTLTLDLNGHTLSSEIGGVATIWNKGTLAIKSSAEGGTITREVSGMYYVIRNNGVMTIDGTNLTVYNDNASDGSSLIDNNILSTTDLEDESIVDRQAKLTITGGTYRSANSNAVKNDPNGTLIINSGSFTSNTAGNGAVFTYDDTTIIGGTFVNNNGYAVFASASGGIVNELKITGGTFTGNYAIHVQNGDPDNADAGKGTIHLTIEDGSFTGEVSAAATGFSITSNETIAVSGGSFNGSFGLSAYDSENISFTGGEFSAAINSSWYDSSLTQYVYTAGEKAGTFGVSSKIPENAIKLCVADRSGNYYATVAEAITALQAASGTRYIYLYVDVTENIEFSSVTGTWYFYLQGNTVNGTITYGGSGTLYIRDENGGGAIRNAGSSSAITLTSGTVRLQTYAGYSVENTDSSNTSPLINVQGGTFYVPTSTSYTGEVALSAANGGLIQVAEGAAANLQYADAVYTVEEGQAIFSGSGTVSVSGGIFSAKFDETFLAEDYIFVEQEGKFAVMQIIAQILQGDEVIYSSVISMQEAVEWAREQGYTSITVQLLANDTEGLTVNVGETITLDLGRYGSSGDIINNGDLTIEGEIQTGSVTSSRTVSGDVINQGSGTLTINGGMFRGAVRNDSTGELIINAGGFGGDNNGSYGNNARNAMQYLAANASFVDRASNQGGYLIADEADTAIYLTDTSVEEPLRFGTFSAAVGYAQYDAASETITFVLSADIQMTGRSTLGYYSSSNATIWEFELGEYSITSTDEYLWTLGNASNRPITVTVMGGELVIMTDGDSSDYAIRIRYGSSLTLNDVNIVYGAETQKPANMIYLSESGGSLSVESGNYYGSIDAVSGASITIAEGCVFEEDIKDVLGDGLTQNESGMVVPEESANAVAMIETETGIVYYDTLQEAVLAVEDGQTITVLADLTFNDALNIFKKDVDGRYTFTIDLNGNTITLSHGDGYPFALQVNGSRNNDSTGFGLIVKNGTIKGEANNTNAAELIRVNNQASLILEDVTIEYTAGVNCSAMVMTLGGIYTDITDPSNPVAYQHILRNVIIKATQAGGVQVEGKAILENCTVDVQKGSGNGSVYVYSAVAASRGGTATIESGTYTSDAYGAYIFTDTQARTSGNLVINGGSFTAGEGYAVLRTDSSAYSPSITVTGGSFDGDIAIAEGTPMALSGGSYTVQLQADWLAADCAQIGADGTFTVGTEEVLVTEQNAVAKIEETGVAYTSLQAAIDACGAEEATITLLRDVELSELLTIPGTYNYYALKVVAGQEITIDFNGYQIIVNDWDQDTNNLGGVIANFGTLTVCDSTDTDGGIVDKTNRGKNGTFLFINSGTLTIENGTYNSYMGMASMGISTTIYSGTFTSPDGSGCVLLIGLGDFNVLKKDGIAEPVFEGALSVISTTNNADDAIRIEWGQFKGVPARENVSSADRENYDEDDRIIISYSTSTGYSSMPICITGGTFEGLFYSSDSDVDESVLPVHISGNAAFTEMPAYGYFAEGYKAVWNAETQMYVTEEGSWAAIVNDETGYGTLADAFAAAEAGDEVVLQSDVTVTETLTIDKSITLDLNGKTITSSADIAVRITSSAEVAARMTVEATIKNGTIIAEDGKQALAVAGAAAELNGVTVQGGTESAVKDLYLITVEDGALTLDAAKVTLEFAAAAGASAQGQAIRSVNSDVTICNKSAIKSDGYGVTFRGALAIAEAAKAETTDGFKTLTIENSSVTAYAFAVSGNGSEKSGSGTVIVVSGSTLESSAATAIYHPQYGVLTIAGDGNKITGETGIEMRAGKLIVEGGTITATGDPFKADPNGNGSTTVGAAVAIVQHNTKQPIAVTLQDGTYAGARSVYEANLQNNEPEFIKDISLAIKDGTYEGELVTEDLAAYVTGGNFAVRPSDAYFGEDFTAQYEGGYYVPVYSTALKEAKLSAKAAVREYAAMNGITWSALSSAAGGADVIAAYNKIDAAVSTLAVAEAKELAYEAIDDYIAAEADAFAQYKADKLAKLNETLADDESTEGVDETVVLPTATWFALNNAATQAEFDEYLANALAEVEAIRSLRTEISGQTGQLTDLATALEAMSSGLFGTEGEDGTLTGGAFADLLGDVKEAIAGAQNAIVNGEEGSASLANIKEYLERTIKDTLDSINDNLTALTGEDGILTQIKGVVDGLTNLDIGGEFDDVFEAITNAQKAIMGAAEGEGGKSIADAIKEINEETATLVNGLRNALIGEDGKSGVLGTIASNVTSLEGMLGNKDSGLAAIVANIKAAQAAILGTASSEDAAATGLQAVLEAVNKANTAVESALDKMNETLAAWQQTVAGYEKTLETIEAALGDGEDSLYDRINEAITAAQNAIMGSTDGVGGTSIGAAVESLSDKLETVQNAIIGAMPNYSEQLEAIKDYVNELEGLLKGDNGLAAIKQDLTDVLTAIGSATSGDTLFGLLETIASGNTAISQTVTALKDALTGTDGAIADFTEALEGMQTDLDSLTGALLTANGGLATGITDAFAAIDKIVAAIGSLGTGEGNDLATQIGGIVSDIEAVQGAVSEIGTNLGVAVDIEESKADALEEIETWLNAYLDALLGGTEEADSGVLLMAVTLETEDGDLYGRLCEAFSEANAQLILKYYNQALTAIDNATSVTDASTAVSTFRAQVASVEAAAENTPALTGVYVLLAIVLVLVIAACVIVILKNRKAAAAAAPAEESKPVTEEKPAETKPEPAKDEGEAEKELAADGDEDKEQVVIAANVRSFVEAYVELDEKQRELFNKVKRYALDKEGASEVKLSSGDCIKLGSKQIVKLTVRRGNPVALFLLENEMLKDFRRNANSQAKLKVRATELVLREEDDLETAYTMVDLSVDQIKKDAEAAKERRREQRRERRRQKQEAEAAKDARDGSED